MNIFKIKFILAGLVSLVIGSVSWALTEPSVSASIYKNSCGYYSNTSGDFLFQYEQKDPNSGFGLGLKRVSLIYGLIGYDGSANNPLEWQDRKEIQMTLVRPGLFAVNEHISLHSRGGSKVYNRIGFVIRLVYLNGEYYDNGGQSNWGSYEVELNPWSTPCVDNYESLPPYRVLPISIHNKN